MWSDLRFRLRALFRRDAVERELDDELRFHVEREAEQLARTGVPHAEALRQARLAFGGLDRAKEESRAVRGVLLLEHTVQDVRYALRGLRTKPGFAAAVVITLGLGIGANAAMFGVIDRLLFRPPPLLRDATTVHRVYLTWSDRGKEINQHSFPYTRFADLTRWTTVFSATAAFSPRRLAVGRGDDAREMQIAAVSASFFEFFDARPALGRFFTPHEDATPAGAPVAVISYALWQIRFGGQTNALGTPLQVGREVYTVIGVAPRDFVGVNDEGPPAVFIPITMFAASTHPSYYKNYNWDCAQMLVRRRPGVGVDAANADLSAAFRQSWRAEDPTPTRFASARPRALAAPIQLGRGPEASRDARLAPWVSGVAFVVLLIACANVANLQLARALRRRREVALRLALGVSRGRLLRQTLTESLLLSMLGGAAGLATAQWGSSVLRALFLSNEESAAVATDMRTIAFAASVSIGAAVLTGLAPALQSARGNLVDALKAGGRGGGYHRSRVRTLLLVFQGALSVVLLVGAGLFVRSMQHVQSLRLGYDVEPLLYIAGDLRSAKLTRAEQASLADRMLSEAAATPGTLRATRIQSGVFLGDERHPLFVAGIDSVQRLGRFSIEAGSPSYFATLGTRIIRGRAFTDEDRANAPRVVVVNEAMASVLWPGRDAMGQCLRVGNDTIPCSTVVGIAENVRSRTLTEPTEFHYYVPILQYEQQFGPSFLGLFVRVDGRASDFAEPIRRRLQRIMPGDGYVTATPLQDVIDPYQRAWRTGATMFVAFGGLALALAAIGLYSVIAYNVGQRMHELSVRVALGAQARDVVGLVVGQGIGLATVGITIGGVLGLWAGRWIAPLLFEQSPRDPVVFGAVAAVLLGVAIVASAIPAMRAARVDPNEALRSD
jgi:putative ABC transport system permease protein